jgi:hypothetical protein
MAGPHGVMAVSSIVTTTEVEDVDDGPLGGCWRHVRQRSPPKLETSMVDPLVVLPVSLTVATTGPHPGPKRCWS